MSVGFQCDGNWMYSGSEDGTVKIWDLRYRKCSKYGIWCCLDLHSRLPGLISNNSGLLVVKESMKVVLQLTLLFYILIRSYITLPPFLQFHVILLQILLAVLEEWKFVPCHNNNSTALENSLEPVLNAIFYLLYRYEMEF